MIAFTASVSQQNIIEGKWHFRLKCKECLRVFAEDEKVDSELLKFKMKTKNLRPLSKSTFNICLATEKLMERFNYEPEKYNMIPEKCLHILSFDELFSYSNFGDHSDLNYKNSLITLIIKMYIKKRQEYISRCKTLAAHDNLLRCHLKKLTSLQGSITKTIYFSLNQY